MKRILLAVLMVLAPVVAIAGPVKILVAYHSETGNTEKLAVAIREGAASVDGIEVLLRKVGAVTDDEIRNTDGILVGTPVHWGNMSAEAKRFLERVGNTLWAAKSSGEGRTAGAFATGGSDDGGKEVARLSMLAAFLGMRFIVIGSVAEDGYGRLGAVAVPGPSGPSEIELTRGREFGKRFATLTRRIRQSATR